MTHDSSSPPAIPQKKTSKVAVAAPPRKHPTPQEIKKLAILLSKNQYAEAIDIAQKMTVRYPMYGEGWKALGIAFILAGQTSKAVAPLQRATEVLPEDIGAHNYLGNTLNDLGYHKEAEASYRCILEIQPDHAEALSNLGNNLKNQERLNEAEACYVRALQLNPNYAQAHNNLGNTLWDLGRFDEAEACFRLAIQLKPDFAAAHCNLGNNLRRRGLLNEAETSYRQALIYNPTFVEAHNNLAFTLRDLGRLDEAVESCRQAIAINPNYPYTYNNLGVALRETGYFEEAAACFRRALELKPEFAEACSNLGGLLCMQDHLNEAVELCRKALQIEPDHAAALCNLAITMKKLGQLDGAEASCRRALEIKPDYVDAQSNLGVILDAQGKCKAAIASHLKTLELKPDFQEARMNLSYAHLSCGQLAEGWKNYEFRTSIDRKRFPHLSFWAGENLHGKSILISGEQGIGDEIMFASQYNEIIAQAERCVIECTAKLVPLFTRSFPNAQILPKINPPHPATQDKFDYQCSAGSLAQWLRPDIECFPKQNIFLTPEPQRIAYWKNRLAKLGPGPKIGINWRSGLQTGERTLHYTKLDQWGPIFTQPGVHFINLQYDECSNELDEAEQRFGKSLHRFPEVDMYNDLLETAALIQALDLAICAPTAVSSIAAALGVNTWVMAYGISWVSLGTDHDPWSPSLRYFSRQWNQTWNETIRDVSSQLKLYVDEGQSAIRSPDAALQQTIRQEIDKALYQAIAQHQSGDLQLAEELYRAILQLAPKHPDANHNLGILVVQKNQPAIALPYLLTALDAEPTKAPYWTSYIDALILAGQTEDAKQILALARQQGLEGEKVDALVKRLEADAIESTDAPLDQPAPEVSQKKKSKIKPDTKKQPGSKEINALSVLFNKGRFEEAATLARQMTERFPHSGMGWKALGAAWKQMGRNADALTAMQKAVELTPADIESLNNLANTLRESGSPEEAVAIFRRLIKINPDDAYAHCNLGVTLRQLRRLDDAEKTYRKALQIKPLFAEAHNNLGNTLKDLDRLHEAETCYRQALKIKPDYAEAHNNLGATLRELGQTEEAVSCYRRAIQLNPAYAEAHSNLGFALRDLDQFDEALTSCRRALELKPDYADAYANQGGILKELGQLDEAIASCRKALEINPYLPEAHNNLGNALQICGDSETAIACFRQALFIKPDYTKARYNLGYAQLACGQLAEGWANHEFRTNIDRKRFPHLPFWSGGNLAGKSILISCEQGIGDEIMFASLFSEIIAQAERCVIECTAKLVPLFARSFPNAQILPKINPPHPATQDKFDYQCAAGSLAQWLRPDIESFPKQNIFLTPEPQRIAYWKNRLAKLGPGPKIGINWRSSLQTGERPLHYTTLDQWGPIFAQPGVHFINLQYDECSAELNEAELHYGVPLHRFPEVDMYNDLLETAALIQALDLVICAPTAVSSIAAALGIDTWVMAYGISWVSLGTDYDPWSPSLRYFSRQWNRTWNEIIRNVSSQLKLYVDETRSDETISSQTITPDAALQQTIRQEIDKALYQAIAQHQSGNMQLAEQLYSAILQLAPKHPDANHNLGILKVQTNQPAIALPYFLAALDAEPTKAPYWISYIDALILAGQTEDAKQILTLARQRGLEGEKVDALVQRLEADAAS